MTNKEAVEILQAYKDRLNSSCSNQLDDDVKAFEIAIDAIKRDSKVDDITFREVVAYECGQKSVETPTGKWIEDYRDGTEYPAFLRQGWRCSVCNSRQTYGTPQYCMRCGAKMIKEGENETN